MKLLATTTAIVALSIALAGCGAANTASNKATITSTTGNAAATATATAMPGSDSPDKAASNANAGTSQETAAMMVKYGMLSGSNKQISEGNVEIKDGKVMLTNFKTSKGPDLHIYLTKGKDVQMGKSLGKIDLEKSEQAFDLAGANLNDYDSVIIYCDKAHVTFGTADLTDTPMDKPATPSAMVTKTGMLSGSNKQISEGNVEIKDGKVMLTNFKTSKGPDLHIYLTKGKDVQMGKSLGKIDLEKSEQTFDLAGANLNDYDSVVIYCDKAHVVFGTADLS
ncbi:DM13 domain-containing protein [Paenibacillus sp. NPDC057934]|uniref:DM13 domain-containing protein n=1 Tax=Paenibacillus sp. NPDC057934 TaxID=3346282 RepID=UPI0036DE9349